MLSVIIPTEGVEQPAVATLAALVPGAAAGVVREVLLVDRSGSDVIERVADVAGCRFLPFDGSHAAALAAGAQQAKSPWLHDKLTVFGKVHDFTNKADTKIFAEGRPLSDMLAEDLPVLPAPARCTPTCRATNHRSCNRLPMARMA